MRALVTGASGFVGANLARRLLSDGHDVHLFLRRDYAQWRLTDIESHVGLHVLDLGSAEETVAAVDAVRPDWIFHLAVHGAYSSQRDVRQMIETNVVSTVNLLEASLRCGFQSFVNTGSSSEYGFKDHAPTEDDRLEPNSPYAVTKAAATHFCRLAAVEHSVRVPTLRLYSVYGPFEEPTRLIPTLIVHGLRGELPPLVNPAVARDYVYIDDVIDAYVLAATTMTEEAGAIYNLGSGVQTTMGEVIKMARQVMDIPAEPKWGSMSDRSWDTSVWVANNTKIRQDLGWIPRLTFGPGLGQTVTWLLSRPDLASYYENRVNSAAR